MDTSQKRTTPDPEMPACIGALIAHLAEADPDRYADLAGDEEPESETEDDDPDR